MIPDYLLIAPPVDLGRYSAAQRARALASLAPLPVRWTPRPDARTAIQGWPNVLLALRDWTPVELKATKATIRDLTRTLAGHRRHVQKLQKAQAVGDDDGH